MKSPWAIPDDPRITEGHKWATEEEIRERDERERDETWEAWWDEIYQDTDPS